MAQRGMDAVIKKSSSSGRRKPALKRKPGLNVVIAMGAPPKPRDKEMEDDEMDESPEMENEDEMESEDSDESYEGLTRRIDELSARLAAMEAKLDTL